MSLLDEAKQIKNEVLHLRAGSGRRFGSKLRGEILDWVARAEASGLKFREACRVVGVVTRRVTKWRQGRRRERATVQAALPARVAPRAMVPVKVGESSTPAEISSITFGTPSGYTISGLTLDQAIGLLRVFS